VITGLRVRPIEEHERPALTELLAREWGSSQIISRGRAHDASMLPALGCFEDDRLVGLATYELSGGECELLTLNALQPRRGIGSRLLDAVTEAAREADCRRLWLVTTNDNLEAISFYERRGMRLAAVHEGAVDVARTIKPSIPEIAPDGTPIRDELEFELAL
jgi:ribosomal protein S18 acetylase RimI-like enzyme